MIVRMWMTRDPQTVEKQETIVKAAQVMAQYRVRRLPVVNKRADGKEVIGIITSHDVLHAFPPAIKPFAVEGTQGAKLDPSASLVSDIMTPNVLTVNVEDPLEVAAKILRDKKVGALPVLLNNRLAGVLTESDCFRALISILRIDKGGVRITFDLSDADGAPLHDVVGLAGQHGLEVASFLTFDDQEKRVAVMRVQGADTAPFIDKLWKLGHRVLTIYSPSGKHRES
jgi:acetoin utilization protein AcuB